jgi:hypothetical protein
MAGLAATTTKFQPHLEPNQPNQVVSFGNPTSTPPSLAMPQQTAEDGMGFYTSQPDIWLGESWPGTRHSSQLGLRNRTDCPPTAWTKADLAPTPAGRQRRRPGERCPTPCPEPTHDVGSKPNQTAPRWTLDIVLHKRQTLPKLG